MKYHLKRILSGTLAFSLLFSHLLPVTAQAAEASATDTSQAIVTTTADDLYLKQGNSEFDIEQDFEGIDTDEEESIAFFSSIGTTGNDFDIHEPDTYETTYTLTSASGRIRYVVRNIHVYEAEAGEDDDSDSQITDESLPEIEAADTSDSLIMATAASSTALAQDRSVLMSYIYCSDKGRGIYNYVKYVASDKRAAYCVEQSKSYQNGSFTSDEWKASRMYSELAFVFSVGCQYYQEKASSAYTSGNWRYDYYATQTAIYAILADYGYDGMAASKFSATSGYESCYNAFIKMYNAAKTFGSSNSHGYGESVHYKIVAPSSTAMYATTISGVEYYRTASYTIDSEGDVASRTISLSGAPSGAEIIYSNSSSLTSSFYVRIKKEDANKLNTEKVSFTINSSVKFNRTTADIYVNVDDISTQDITFLSTTVPSTAITSSASASLTVEKAKIQVTKKDSSTGETLKDAVFGIYTDSGCNNLLTTITTNSSGVASAEFVKTQNTYYIKEITAPAGYVLNTNVYNCTVTIGETSSLTITDNEQLAVLTIYKEGEVLSGADITEDGVFFTYETARLAGATYSLYAGDDITTPSGSAVLYKADELVADNLTTTDGGAVIIENLHLGSYYIVETGAPKNYVISSDRKDITLSYAGQNVNVVYGSAAQTNERQKAALTVSKVDKNTNTSLSGGIYGVYAGSDIKNASGTVIVPKDTLLETMTTDKTGSAVTSTDLPIGYRYYVKEIQAPNLYFRDSDDTYTFSFDYTDENESVQHFSYEFRNTHVTAKITLKKRDADTNTAVPQGDGSLAGASYGLYARKDITHPDGTTTLYKADEQVALLKTDSNGQASIDGLYLGVYYLKEISSSNGYLVDGEEIEIDCSYEGDLTAEVTRTAISHEQVKKQAVQLIKAANNGKTDADLLEGVGFTAWLLSSLSINSDGSYDFDSADPIVIGENGATEIFTDKNGFAQTIELPYGTYIFRETTIPHNYLPVDDFIVTINEDSREPQTWRVLLDEEFKAKLKIVKMDAETGQSVLLPDTEFRIYDMDNETYVTQVTTYPTIVTHKTFFTDSDGYLILPQNLPIGNYRIEEVTAPHGYVLNDNYIEISVDNNTFYEIDKTSGDAIITVYYEDTSAKGVLEIIKKGEVLSAYEHSSLFTRLTGSEPDFQYKIADLADAVFELYAAEDIYTADNQKDTDGNRILIYTAGELVTTVTTDHTGKATIADLPLGAYRVVEKQAPDGFVGSAITEKVTFVYVDGTTSAIVESVEYLNERQKIAIEITKLDEESGAVLAGATFGLYAAEDILDADGRVILPADTLIETVMTDTDGKAGFTKDLPLGTYYLKELTPPDGYLASDEIIHIDATYQGQAVEIIYISETFENTPTTVEITKSDITTTVELIGAELSVLDSSGAVIDSWISTGEPHIIKGLHIGETYTLREDLAPLGYLKAQDITFQIEDTGEIQKVAMFDEVPTGKIILNKQGEFLDCVSLYEKVTGWFSYLFHYVMGTLSDVTFEIYAAEDVGYADGITDELYYEAGELVAEITTDEYGIATLDNLPLGTYSIQEVQTADGYVLDTDERIVTISYVDQYTEIITYTDDWLNSRQTVSITLSKLDADTDEPLSGAHFGLYSAEDIFSAGGTLLIEADTVIEHGFSDENGMIHFEADLPLGNYYIAEIAAPTGYASTNEIISIDASYQGDDVPVLEYEYTIYNEITKLEISKVDITDEDEIEGAELTVTDEDGSIIDTWTSTKEPHLITGLEPGRTYTLTEITAPYGYLIAEEINFTIEDTGEIQTVVMKDAHVSGQLQLNKTDKDTGESLEGVEFTLYDSDGAAIETLITDKDGYAESALYPIGSYENGSFTDPYEYTLKETKALDGYQKNEEIYTVTFSYIDDKTAVVEYVLDIENEQIPAVEEEPATTTAPKTGDDTNPYLPLIGGISSLLLISIIYAGKKFSKKRRPLRNK